MENLKIGVGVPVNIQSLSLEPKLLQPPGTGKDGITWTTGRRDDHDDIIFHADKWPHEPSNFMEMLQRSREQRKN